MKDKEWGRYGCVVDGQRWEDCIFNYCEEMAVYDCAVAADLIKLGLDNRDCVFWQEKPTIECTCPKCGHRHRVPGETI